MASPRDADAVPSRHARRTRTRCDALTAPKLVRMLHPKTGAYVALQSQRARCIPRLVRTLHPEAGAHVTSRSWRARYTPKLYARCAESFALSVRHCRHPRSSGPSQCEKTRKTLKRRNIFSILLRNSPRSSRPSRRPRELTPNRTKRHIRSIRARKSLRICQIRFRGTHFSMLSPRAPLTRTILPLGEVMLFFI